MENIRDLLKRYYDTKVKRTFRLFPIYNKKKSNRYHSVNQDEDQKEEEGEQLSLNDRFLIYNYLKHNADLN
jgi:hypothetical protein